MPSSRRTAASLSPSMKDQYPLEFVASSASSRSEVSEVHLHNPNSLRNSPSRAALLRMSTLNSLSPVNASSAAPFDFIGARLHTITSTHKTILKIKLTSSPIEYKGPVAHRCAPFVENVLPKVRLQFFQEDGLYPATSWTLPSASQQ